MYKKCSSQKISNLKINVVKSQGNEENISQNKKSLALPNQRSPMRKKSSLQVKMANAFCTKKYKNESGSHGAKILKDFHESKSLKNGTPKESDSNLECNTNNLKNSKNDVEEKKEVAPEIKHNINYNININNSNTNEILDLLKFTNNLYNKDNHLQKEIPTKKLDINNISKFDKNFNKGLAKKKLYIQFGLNNVKRKSFKSTKDIPKDNRNKINFSNYIQFKQNQNIENSEDSNEYEENKTINISKGNFTSKSSKKNIFHFNKSKKKKNKKMKSKVIFEQSEKENENSNPKSKRTKNSKKGSSKKFIEQVPQQMVEEKEKELKIDNDKKEKKYKFNLCHRFFCCLNSELNDSQNYK